MRPIEGMSVLITGGGSGLGAGAAALLARKGAKVTISGRRADKVRAVAEAIGPNCTFVAADVTSDADRRAMLDKALAHGGGKLDVLFNNAGNMLRGNVDSYEEETLRAVFDSNVIAPMMLTKLCSSHLIASKGSIIFIGSGHTRRSFPGASPYAATKGAIETLTRVLAAELGPKQVRVNCIIPGGIPTEINIRAGVFTEAESDDKYASVAPMHALGRNGTSEEIAEAVEYLARAEWTTGSSMVVDGGMQLGVSFF